MESHRNLFDKTRIETAIWASKVVLLVIGAISTATVFKVAVIPYILNLSLSTVPKMWLSFKTSFVSPLYIYIAVNFIIAAIVVSSSFSHRNHGHNKPTKIQKSSSFESSSHINSASSLDKSNSNSWESFRIVQEENRIEEDRSPPDVGSEEQTPPESGSGGESSMEETWEAIMVANKSKGLKRSETFAAVGPKRPLERSRGDDDDHDGAKRSEKEMRKWDTFNDRVSLRKDDNSMTHDELSRRAEAFIKKVNNDMRLQRLESEQRFIDMVKRGL